MKDDAADAYSLPKGLRLALQTIEESIEPAYDRGVSWIRVALAGGRFCFVDARGCVAFTTPQHSFVGMPSTRAQARTSPSDSTLTPDANIASPGMEPESASRGPTPSPISLAENNDAEMAAHSTSIPTSPNNEATVLPGDESSQNIQSDRVADFEEETTRARRNAREIVEDTNLDEEAKQSVTQEAGHGDQKAEHVAEAEGPEQTPQESLGAEAAGEHTAEESKAMRDATPVRSQALWIDDAVSRAARNKVVTSSNL